MPTDEVTCPPEHVVHCIRVGATGPDPLADFVENDLIADSGLDPVEDAYVIVETLLRFPDGRRAVEAIHAGYRESAREIVSGVEAFLADRGDDHPTT